MRARDLANIGFGDIQARILGSDNGGWVAINPTEHAAWTYNAVNTVNVPSGAANYYRDGDRVRFKQSAGTFKYFFVTSVTDTTLVLDGQGTYTVANEAITEPEIARGDLPVGMDLTVAAGTGGGITNIRISAGTASNYLSALTLSNSNGISFGLNGSTITASHNGLTSQSNQAASASNGSFAFQTLAFSNANAVTFGTSAGSIITASVASSLTNIKVSAGTLSNNISALTFNDSNGVSFGLDGSVITATVATNYLTSQSNQAASASNGSFAFQTLGFSNANNVTFGTSAGSIVTASVVPGLTNINVSAGTTSNNLSALTFANLNGVTFGLDGSTVTASHNGMQSQSNQAVQAGGDIETFQTLSFGDTNSVSFMITNGSVAVESIKLNMYAVSNTTQSTSGTANHTALSFGGAGIASVGVTGGSVVISVPSPTGISNINISAGTTSNNLSALTFANSNGVSFGLNGSQITATVATNYLTSQSNQALSAANGSFTFQTATFADSNGISFSTGTQGLYASHNGLTSQSNQAASASNGSFAFQTLAFSNANNVTFGTSAGSIITASISPGGAGDGVNIIAAGTQTANTTGTVLFQNSNGITFGMSNSSVVTASHNGLTSQSNQAASCSNGSFAFQTVAFSNANNVTFGTSAGSIITASVLTPLTVSSTVIGAERGNYASAFVSNSPAFVWLCPAQLPVAVAMSQVKLRGSVVCATSAAGTHRKGYTALFGIYSRHPSSSTVITQHYSTSWTVSVSASTNTRFGISCITGIGNSTSYSSEAISSAGPNATAYVQGIRELQIACVTTLSAGEWWYAIHQSSSTAGVAGVLFNISLDQVSAVSGNRIGISPNATSIGLCRDIGLGYYSASTAALPGGITLTSDIIQWPLNAVFYPVAVSN